jgi:arsenate reductase
MSDVTIYHNPGCSKSRQALELIRRKGIEPRIIKYLETPPSADELAAVLKKLSLNATALIRTSESIYADVNPDRRELSQQDAIELMVVHPKLIQRPIIVAGDRAIIGRPPENVDAIL